MKLPYGTICLIASALTSCMWGKPVKEGHAVTKDTLAYSYKVFKERADDCGTKPDTNCSIITFKYPVFTGNTKLNDSVSHQLLAMFARDHESDTTFQLMAKYFFTGYKKDKSGMIYKIAGNAKVLRQDSSLTTLQTDGYSFQGGAHPVSFKYFFNWDTQANKKISLGDLLITGNEVKLSAVGEAIFRKNEKLSDTASLANNYFFKDNKFALNDNFLITPLGIKFYYNEYEIKSYAAGPTNLLLPYAQIKSLLKPNTVLTQYIK